MALCLSGIVRADEAADQFNVAGGFYKMNRFEFAAEEYERFLKDYPKHEQVPEALYFLGESYYHLGKLEAAREKFRRVVAQYPAARNFFYAVYRVGETSLLLGDLKAAEPPLAEVVSKRPDDPLMEFALADLGRVQLLAGKPKEARATLEKSLERFPNGRAAERSQYDLSQALERLNETQAALARYRALAANPAGKLAADAQLAIGVRLFDEKNYEAAAQAFAELEQKFSDSPLVTTARLNRGLCLYQAQRFDQAQAIFEPLAAAESSVPEAWYWLGMTQKARRQFAAAAQTLADGSSKFASSSLAGDMLFYSAQATLESGRPAAALERFLQVAGRFPQHDLADDALYHAAEAGRGAGQHDRVLALAAQLAQQYPQSPLANRMGLAVGQSLIAAGRADEAAKQLAELLARKPEPAVAAPAQYYRAVALQTAGKLEDALAALAPLLQADAAKEPAAANVIADAHFLAGACHFQNKDHAKATPLLEKYLATRPNGDVAGHAMSYLAVSHAALGQFEQLRRSLDLLRTKTTKELSVPAIYRVAETCYEGEQYALASELFAEVAREDPQGPLHAKALSGLGWSRYQERKLEAAAQSFGQLVELHPADALASEAAYMRGRALEAAAKLPDATAAYQTVLAKYGQSPQAFDAGLQLARTLQKAGKSPEAAAAYEDLTKRFPKANGLDTALYEWAWVHLAQQQEAESQQVFRRLASEFPTSPLVPEATLAIAEHQFRTRQFGDVTARLKAVLAKESSPAVREAALYRLGRTYLETAAWPDAKATFEQLGRDYPSSSLKREAEFWIAESERQQGQPKPAAERLAKLLAEPAQPEPWLGTAWLRLAQCQGEMKQWKDALATIAELKKRLPSYELINVADYHAGRALQNMARFDEAREAYRRAVTGHNDENAAQSQFMIGETFFHQKRYQEALREFLKVEILYAFPQWQAAALLEAAKCHEYLQEWPRAAETYNRILEKYPKTTHAAEAAGRLPAAQKKVTSRTPNEKGAR